MEGKMKAAINTDLQTIVIDEVPIPQPGPGEVLVQVKATGLCGSDVDGYLGHHPMMKWPLILGHECSGVVAELGPGVEDWQVGDAVAVEPFFTCKTCPACLRGKYNLCIDLKITGHQVPGSIRYSSLSQTVIWPRFLITSAGIPAFFTASTASAICFSTSLIWETFSAALSFCLSVRGFPKGVISSKYGLIFSS